jgi:hypothetical protein
MRTVHCLGCGELTPPEEARHEVRRYAPGEKADAEHGHNEAWLCERCWRRVKAAFLRSKTGVKHVA